MGAVYGAGFLNFLPGTDRTEDEDIDIMMQLAKQVKPYYAIREVIADKVASFLYDEVKEKVEISWLEGEEANEIKKIKENSGGSAPWSRFEFIDFETLIPLDFCESYRIELDLPDGDMISIKCSSMLMEGDRLRWLNEDLESGKRSGTDKYSAETFIEFHNEINKDLDLCANPGLIYCIR